MTVDATKPLDTDPIVDWPEYIRLIAVDVNALEIAAGVATTTIEVASGATAITGSTAVGIDMIFLTGDGAVNVSSITGTGVTVKGNIKIILFGDGNVTFVDDDGNIELKDESDWTPDAYDSLTLSYDGTDWREIDRSSKTSDIIAIAQGGTGQITAAAAFTALKQDASATVSGVVELATDAETLTGTDTVRALTPANLTAKLATPGAIGGTVPGTGTFTSLNSTKIDDSGALVDVLTGANIRAVDGLLFGADTAAANMLDDYEEGFYTATLVCGTSGTITISADTDQLAYTKVGRVVTVQGLITVDSVSSPAGTVVLNLPTVAADLTESAGVSSGSIWYTNVVAFATAGALTLIGTEGAANVSVVEQSTTGVEADIGNNFQATTQIGVNFSYISV